MAKNNKPQRQSYAPAVTTKYHPGKKPPHGKPPREVDFVTITVPRHQAGKQYQQGKPHHPGPNAPAKGKKRVQYQEFAETYGNHHHQPNHRQKAGGKGGILKYHGPNTQPRKHNLHGGVAAESSPFTNFGKGRYEYEEPVVESHYQAPSAETTPPSPEFVMIHQVLREAFGHNLSIPELRIKTVATVHTVERAYVYTINPTRPLCAGKPSDLAIRVTVDEDGDLSALFVARQELSALRVVYPSRRILTILQAGQVVRNAPYMFMDLKIGEFTPGAWQQATAQAAAQAAESFAPPETPSRTIYDQHTFQNTYVEEQYSPSYCCDCGARMVSVCPQDCSSSGSGSYSDY